MSLTSGTRIGPFVVTGSLGVGGMGEVYRARDGRLNRDVALKVLPDLFAHDADRLARFTREAQVLASLNHTNIAAIYGVEDEGATRAIAMELVEGPTLADRIALGPLPIDEALAIARQVADGLEAAHEQGVVHRDLKPANIKVRPDGTVKVLDFGLAKALEGDVTGSAGLSMSPTITSPAATRMGVILGTAAYMAPEQARGWPVDRRADVWAFGCVLYEMVSGRRAFQGEDITETLAAVMRDSPPLDAVPMPLRRIVQACLERDPGKRLRGVGDAMRLVDDPIGAAPGGTALDVAASATTEARRGVHWPLPWAVAAAAVIAAMVLWLRPASAPVATPAEVTRLAITMPETHDLFTGGGAEPAITPDGRTVVYLGLARDGGRRLYRRDLDRLESEEIGAARAASDVAQPAVSPDGTWVSFQRGGAVYRVGLNGPGLQKVSDDARGVRGTTWLDNDTVLFSATQDGERRLMTTAASGGTPAVVTGSAAMSGVGYAYPHARQGVLAYVHWTGAFGTSKVFLRSLATGAEREVATGSSPRLTATGHLLFVREDGLWAVKVDANRQEAVGQPVRVVEDVQANSGGLGLYTVSDSGTLVYVPGRTGTQRTLTWVDGRGREFPISAAPGEYRSARVSPDGSRIVMEVGRDRDAGLWLWDERRALLTRFAASKAVDSGPEWTRDGLRIVFASDRDGRQNLWSQAVDGVAGVERVRESKDVEVPLSVAPDGRLVFMHRGEDGRATLELLTPGRAESAVSLMPSDTEQSEAAVSPSGLWLAYQSAESGEREVYVRPFPNVNGGKWQVSSGGGTAPAWSPDGRILYFVGAAGLMQVPVRAAARFDVGEVTLAVPARYLLATDNRRNYDVAPDGRFLMIKEAGAQHLVVVQNWISELQRLLPTE